MGIISVHDAHGGMHGVMGYRPEYVCVPLPVCNAEYGCSQYFGWGLADTHTPSEVHPHHP